MDSGQHICSCTHYSARHKAPCSCTDFKPSRSTQDKCQRCGHEQAEHIHLGNLTPLPLPSPPPSQPVASSSRSHCSVSKTTKPTHTVQSIVSQNISDASEDFVKKLGKEIKHGMKMPLKTDPHTESSNSRPSQSSKGTSKAETGKGNASTRVLAIIFNPHGLTSLNGGDALEVNAFAVKAKLDHYVALGMARGYDESEHARWVLCSKSRKQLITVPVKFPTAFDMYDKRTLDSKNWTEQMIYIALQEPILKSVMRKYAPEKNPSEFNNIWATLTALEHWPYDEGDIDDAEVVLKRKRPTDDDSSDLEETQVHKTPRQSTWLLSVNKAKISKGKERAASVESEILFFSSDDEMKDESLIASDLMLSSPIKADIVKSQNAFDPWDWNYYPTNQP
ncbi:hypothetical protein VKT23_020280 [Stygiomarasmius scandens]|uniref:Uncharacterized protein n=1 Tax=Marasmiellus scandens TaxID=2682957 RepID=A0ABR1IJF8_9AGAR